MKKNCPSVTFLNVALLLVALLIGNFFQMEALYYSSFSFISFFLFSISF